ncbi:hypothetical protein HanXRQr2_Chr12g0534541 [Helianthus annuus]|uniref:Uncharacterized protein n=1 Tax=Helianthus annuus TaxID=4232 RepID=A0A9K3HFF8_HELAN|nr:hypothetical protein HanXRQr2_Chr12g0534541 [Helianthus annuus]KAJ0862157.1 hypothetical protein HanPSC8_Chr12g0514861 [Helianthus annuus]
MRNPPVCFDKPATRFVRELHCFKCGLGLMTLEHSYHVSILTPTSTLKILYFFSHCQLINIFYTFIITFFFSPTHSKSLSKILKN